MSGGSSLPEAAAAERAVPSSVSVLDASSPAWDDLAANAIEPNPFYEHWMLQPALRAYAGNAGVKVVCVKINEQLAGLFPFETLKSYRGLPVRALKSWRHRNCVLGTPLIRSGTQVACLRALFAWAREQGTPVIEFDYVAADGPFQLALLDALGEAGLASLAMDGFTRGLLRRDKDAASYVSSSLSKEYRKQLGRYGRRLSELGKVEHVELLPGGDPGRWIDDFLRLEAAGWKGRNGSALACREEDRAFAVEVFHEAFRRGRFVALGLDLDGKPLSRLCGFVAGEGSFVFKTAYDEALSRFSPGILVGLDWIERVHARADVRWTDSFTHPGNHMIKRLWKDGRAIHRVAVGVTRRGQFALSLLPLLRFLKSQMKRGQGR